MNRRELSALVDYIYDGGLKVVNAKEQRITDTYLRIASYRETGRKLDYILWDVCPQCGGMCSLNGDPICGECEWQNAITADKDDEAVSEWERKREAQEAYADDYEHESWFHRWA